MRKGFKGITAIRKAQRGNVRKRLLRSVRKDGRGEAHASDFSLVSGLASLAGTGTTMIIGIVTDYAGFSKIIIAGAIFQVLLEL